MQRTLQILPIPNLQNPRTMRAFDKFISIKICHINLQKPRNMFLYGVNESGRLVDVKKEHDKQYSAEEDRCRE
jgi:hypothetical protein